MESKIKLLLSKLTEKHTRFRTHLRRSWINVELHSQIKEILLEKCKDENYKKSIIVNCESPVGKKKQQPIKLNGKNLLDFVNSNTGAGTGWTLQWTLVSSIALFEAFITDTAAIVYMSNPEKFLLNNQHNDTDSRENHKVSKILIESNSREEALEKLIEEKLRSIFYGNPINAFISYKKNNKHLDGKLKLNLDKEFHDKCSFELLLYKEMLGRRNAIVHNAGIIDDKYIREIDDICIKISKGNKAKIEENYLFNSLKILDKLANVYIEQVLSQIKKETWS